MNAAKKLANGNVFKMPFRTFGVRDNIIEKGAKNAGFARTFFSVNVTALRRCATDKISVGYNKSKTTTPLKLSLN